MVIMIMIMNGEVSVLSSQSIVSTAPLGQAPAIFMALADSRRSSQIQARDAHALSLSYGTCPGRRWLAK